MGLGYSKTVPEAVGVKLVLMVPLVLDDTLGVIDALALTDNKLIGAL